MIQSFISLNEMDLFAKGTHNFEYAKPEQDLRVGRIGIIASDFMA